MSGGSQFPYNSHPNHQHNPYHSYAHQPDQQNTHFHIDPNANAYPQHSAPFSTFNANAPQHPQHFYNQHPSAYPNGAYSYSQPQQHPQSAYSAPSDYNASYIQLGNGIGSFVPHFDSTGAESYNASPQHLQPGQWHQQSASPQPYGGSAPSHSPHSIAGFENHRASSHDPYQQQTPVVTPAQFEAAPGLVKHEASLDDTSTQPFNQAEIPDASPQEPLRIKLKRSIKVQETSSGGQQAQAQLQIPPPENNNMPIGRPSRAAAAAASAGISNSYSDSLGNKSLRSRNAKQAPGSEEDYEEVSHQQQTKPTHDEVDEAEQNDNGSIQQEQQRFGKRSSKRLSYYGSFNDSIPPSSQKRQQTKAKKSAKANKEDEGKKKAFPTANVVPRRPRASTSNSLSIGGGQIAGARSAKPKTSLMNIAIRRSTRLSGDSLATSSQSRDMNTRASLSREPSLGSQGIEAIFAGLRKSDADEQDEDDEDAEADNDPEGEEHVGAVKEEDGHREPEPFLSTSRRGRVRRTRVAVMAESEDSEEAADDDDDDDEGVRNTRRSSRKIKGNSLGGFVAADDDEEEEDDEGEYGAKRSTRSSGRLRRGGGGSSNRLAEMAAKKRAANGRGRPGKRKIVDDEFEMEGDETPEEEHISGAEDDPLDIHSDEPEGSQGKSYSLRQRKKVNYSLVPPPPSPPRDGFGRAIRNNRGRGGNNAYDLDPPGGGADSGTGSGPGLPMPFPGRGKKGKEGWDALPSSMSGKDYARIFGDPVDSSDDELQNNAFRKPGGPAALGGGGGAGGLLGAGGAGGAGAPPGGLTGSGGTDSFGRIKKSGDPLADVDPLGVDMNIDFDSVGGLDGHIQQLKEMVMLPLLYPEVFQRFKVTPPRGVLFHGPPGTGKTLVARALAASCSTEGQQVSFFMRKGADCLSKWVGEAERQLRLLFEEARASQPSIIFFDEIDGLAPVRSSRQDQIHASIVSTMLALMDGMDGRGQVVVIGATNRPDSVDPALRRPGRFDREFYFPLPSLEARKSIINIHTRKWEPPLDDDFKARLAEVTKGYGGADLRALCTEAALNAIQRRYPQIYSTTDRLLLDPASIQVDAKDFMMSVNKIFPSSARASASAAAPLPERLIPLLGAVVQNAISVLDRILPPVSKRNPLEEALWEDDVFAPKGLTAGLSAADMLAGDRGFGREMLLQSFEAQRVYRPRMLVHGDVGMGQGAVGAALLQHLEGYHVQSLDIGTLLGDSARTPEAAIIQLFVEAKRHKPSVLYIPGIVHWARSVSESVKTTFKALLDGLTDADPVMLLGVAEAPLDELDDEVHSWFNFLDDDVVEIPRPDEASRRAFFQEILDHVIRPPTEFPDALPRRKRVLEELPKAPPRPPRKLTQAELQQQADNDAKLLEHLKYRLGPVLAELRKKFKKFTRDVWDEYNLRELTQQFEWKREKGKITVELRYYRPGAMPQPEQADKEGDAEMLETEAEVAAKRGITAAQFMGPPAASITEIEEGEGANGEVQGAGDGADVEMVNGDAAPEASVANGTANGVSQDAESETVPADAVPPPPSSQPNGHIDDAHTADPQAADVSTSEPLVAAPADADASAAPTSDYITRTMPIWTTNLEKMQKRLYYNGYLSCNAFMEDIQKIVENAEEAAEVDQERVFRAHQMRNLAIVLMDQYIDAGFREECDRMALRQLAREQEAREATEKAKQSAEEAAKKAQEGAKGERASARIAGKEPEMAEGLGGGQKRQRSVSGQAAATDAIAAATTAEAASTTETQVEAEAEDEARKRARLTSPSPSEPIAAPEVAPSTADQLVPEPQPEPEPHPPLTYTPSAYTHIQSLLLTSTAAYNIDQLSRLRAACFNAIWLHRSDWNRDGLIENLAAICQKSSHAVQREQSGR